MDWIVEGSASRKRAWEGRWETAEERDKGKGGDHMQEGVEDAPLGSKEGEEAVEESKRALGRDTALLISAVDANQQIEEQERMQRQQDKESEVARAALEVEASIRGQEASRGAPRRHSKLPPKPRLDLAAARRQAGTTSESEASVGGGLDRAEESGKKKGRGRRRKSASRTPRGRTHGQDTMD